MLMSNLNTDNSTSIFDDSFDARDSLSLANDMAATMAEGVDQMQLPLSVLG